MRMLESATGDAQHGDAKRRMLAVGGGTGSRRSSSGMGGAPVASGGAAAPVGAGKHAAVDGEQAAAAQPHRPQLPPRPGGPSAATKAMPSAQQPGSGSGSGSVPGRSSAPQLTLPMTEGGSGAASGAPVGPRPVSPRALVALPNGGEAADGTEVSKPSDGMRSSALSAAGLGDGANDMPGEPMSGGGAGPGGTGLWKTWWPWSSDKDKKGRSSSPQQQQQLGGGDDGLSFPISVRRHPSPARQQPQAAAVDGPGGESAELVPAVNSITALASSEAASSSGGPTASGDILDIVASGGRVVSAGAAEADLEPGRGGVSGGELREVIQLVEEVMRRMREIYGADREIGDMSLGSITQFVYRKLRWDGGRGRCKARYALPDLFCADASTTKLDYLPDYLCAFTSQPLEL